MIIRPLQSREEVAVRELLTVSALFGEDEIDAAVEQVRTFLLVGADSPYQLYGAEIDERLVGFISLGPTPKSEGVYDLYWIAVAAGAQSQGIGTQLMWFVEDWVRDRGGSTILIETWAGDAFAPTRRFYERRGYTEESRVIDFGRARHDRIILSKTL